MEIVGTLAEVLSQDNKKNINLPINPDPDFRGANIGFDEVDEAFGDSK